MYNNYICEQKFHTNLFNLAYETQVSVHFKQINIWSTWLGTKWRKSPHFLSSIRGGWQRRDFFHLDGNSFFNLHHKRIRQFQKQHCTPANTLLLPTFISTVSYHISLRSYKCYIILKVCKSDRNGLKITTRCLFTFE